MFFGQKGKDQVSDRYVAGKWKAILIFIRHLWIFFDTTPNSASDNFLKFSCDVGLVDISVSY